MAEERGAHPDNAPGDFFVDTTCIDCPTCRQIAPAIFGDAPDQAVVARQPADQCESLRALMALVSCPAGSIGTRSHLDVREAFRTLPEEISGGVFYCGFASPDSFGGQSYLIRRPAGNVLVDSPRFAGPLVRRLEEFGGVRWMFLTHQDDVADHEKFRRHFGLERIIHEAEAVGTLMSVEKKLEGKGPWALASDLKIIATPGHTRGHAVLLYREFLFTGDHLFWRQGGLDTSRRYNQYSWQAQIESVEKLREESFTWALPGHGYRFHAPADSMRQELEKAIERMRGYLPK